MAPRGVAYERGMGRALDALCAWCMAAVRARVIATADEQALAYLGAERGLERLPGEFLEAYRTRVARAWDYWRLGGTRPGMQLALELLGYDVTIIEHGLPPPDGQSAPDRVWWSEFTIWLRPGSVPGYGAVLWGEEFGVPPTQHVWGEANLLWGTSMPAREMWRIMATICQMKSAHSRPRQVFYAPRMHFWGDVNLEWGDPEIEWGGGVGTLQIPIPTGRVCEPVMPRPPEPPGPGSGTRWGEGPAWQGGPQWGTGGTSGAAWEEDERAARSHGE
jgi:hypothetical protein